MKKNQVYSFHFTVSKYCEFIVFELMILQNLVTFTTRDVICTLEVKIYIQCTYYLVIIHATVLLYLKQ